ncbi:MAG: phage tail protein [Myxococcota bacterium]
MSTGLAIHRRGHIQPGTGDYRYLEDVVRIGYPVRDALTYLNRHLGNPATYRLVEALRGERPGCVRSVEVQPAVGGEPTYVRAVRVLPDGSPASYFTPDDMVTVQTEVVTPDGRPPTSLQARDKVVLHIPVRGYLRYLPGLFQGAVPAQRRDIVRADEVSARRWGQKDTVHTTEVQGFNADALRRFLFIFQHLMTSITDRIDQIPTLIDPATTDPRFLPWIASWVSFELDSSLPIHQQRELVRRAIRLYRTRGTVAGIEEMIRVLTSAPVAVNELRPPKPFVLGRSHLAGGPTVEARYVRGEPAASFVVEPSRAKTTFFALVLEDEEKFRKRFGERAPVVLRRIAQIVTNEKPAHVTFTILFDRS